ncbi:molybdopterin-dependent oxidoreductase [Salidesulfovibrio onnuriiensis]|uniref:molybdopterin-dependent oxidoreductase n=1 Tax=Salidesulfovibrio onnuriiensis TaxID=2583823 RepID=UPI0011C8A489|nr:molybdopterin-dependent oxidoreductase [Salidesulfovibrio onnuriiensis]
MKVITACTLDCPDTCSCIVDTEKRTVSGNPDHPITKGVVCGKVKNFFGRLDASERITEPLLRKDGSFVPVGWDEALDLCAKKIDALRTSPEKILHMRGYGYRGIFAHASSAFFRALGSSTIRGSICDGAGTEAMTRCCGSLMANDPEDLFHARRIVNWGRDLSRSSIHTGLIVREARKRGVEVLTISVGGDGNDAFSDETITIRPGTDRFLAAAVIKLYLESGLLDSGVIARTSNWPVFRGLVESLSLDELCAACGLCAEDVEVLFDWYEQPGAVATLVGWGMQRYVNGGENVRYVASLGMLAGHIGRKGGGVHFGFPSSRNFKKWWAETEQPAPAERREMLVFDLANELRRADPPVEFAFIDGVNAATQLPDSLGVAAELERIPFVVCMEGYMTDTARAADLILPPAYMFERDEVAGSWLHNFVQYSRQAVEPPNQCRDIYDVLADLGARLASPVCFPNRGRCISSSLEDSGISLEELSEKGFARGHWPMVAYEGMRFDTPDRKFLFPEALSPIPDRDPDFPLQLLSLVQGKYLQSQLPEADQRGVPTVQISPHSPAWDFLDLNRDVYLASPLGSMQVRVEPDDTLHPEAVVLRRGGWTRFGRNPNAVIQARSTDMGENSAYYSQPVRLENR